MNTVNPHYQGAAEVIKESPLIKVAIATGLVALAAGTAFALHHFNVSGFQNMHFQAAYIGAATAGTISTLALLALGFNIYHKKHISDQPFPVKLDEIQSTVNFEIDEPENDTLHIRKVTAELEETDDQEIKDQFTSAMKKFHILTPVKKWLMENTVHSSDSDPASYLNNENKVTVTQVELKEKPKYGEDFPKKPKQVQYSEDPFTYADDDGNPHAYPVYGNGNVFGGSAKTDGGAQEEMVSMQALKLFFLDYLFANKEYRQYLLPQSAAIDANGHPTKPTPVLIDVKKEYDIGIYGTEKMWTRNIAGLSHKLRPAAWLIATIALGAIALAVMHNMGLFQHHQTLNMLSQTKILLPATLGLTALAIGVLAGIARLRYPTVDPVEGDQPTVTLFNIAARDYKTHPKDKYDKEDLKYHYDTLVAAFEGLKAEKGENVVVHMSDWGTGVFRGSRNTMVTLILAAARATNVQLKFDKVDDKGDYSEENIERLAQKINTVHTSPHDTFEFILGKQTQGVKFSMDKQTRDNAKAWRPRQS
ncbi:MAG: hypothetical protein K940chlam9_00016 [Chlamydiae bacterium]|nr:hypothetical protein [Chlamydiota bacterium]